MHFALIALTLKIFPHVFGGSCGKKKKENEEKKEHLKLPLTEKLKFLTGGKVFIVFR